ncbi:molybdate ABC transporter substrate-binding protein [Magnetospira sp. QH-2]|uniref:molybdate ABC transporter substrate-binding protein n=1 Tax=Magnetospira sp. (strain QH-2) TaxID=1288970 RepID=UPI0003E8158A|nr:molybdate ABC transporter substrate-binding protein [Magnetospira sp. QH-2]CCQ74748.1 Molybdate-binding periplasmic protein [Magnetospira sp. QH-2]
MTFRIALPALLLCSILTGQTAFAGNTTIAVAANFTATAKDLAEAFKEETGHRALLAFGSTGKLYAQIANGAPFEAFLAADSDRPRRVEEDDLAVAGSRFTYAKGKIALYSRDPGLVDDLGQILKTPDRFRKLAIANPKTAPYGRAAVETLRKLLVYEFLESKLVRGDNIAQTHQFVATGNAALGFVALAQVTRKDRGSKWIVPEDLYSPIRQDAVLLKTGETSEAARAFIAFLKEDKARAIISGYGYGLD